MTSAHPGQDDFSVAPMGDGFDSLTDELRARVKGELEPGERLLWAARSEPPFVRFGFAFYGWSVITVIMLALGALGIIRALNQRAIHRWLRNDARYCARRGCFVFSRWACLETGSGE